VNKTAIPWAALHGGRARRSGGLRAEERPLPLGRRDGSLLYHRRCRLCRRCHALPACFRTFSLRRCLHAFPPAAATALSLTPGVSFCILLLLPTTWYSLAFHTFWIPFTGVPGAAPSLAVCRRVTQNGLLPRPFHSVILLAAAALRVTRVCWRRSRMAVARVYGLYIVSLHGTAP